MNTKTRSEAVLLNLPGENKEILREAARGGMGYVEALALQREPISNRNSDESRAMPDYANILVRILPGRRNGPHFYPNPNPNLCLLLRFAPELPTLRSRRSPVEIGLPFRFSGYDLPFSSHPSSAE